jgi:uncharacterized protein YecE (DUF72 family)
MLRIGCSGWNYNSWRGTFYPKGMGPARWLREYATHFDTVEVNSTFYRLASRDAVARWAADTPDDFCFTVKASRYLTHIKRLQNMDEGVKRFYERIDPLIPAGKLGPVLWQLPPNFQRDDDRLATALAATPPGRHAWEFRHPSWFTDDVYALLREHGAALVIGDSPDRPFQTYEMTADWTFVRFHYGRKGRRGNYSRAEIATWADRLTDWHRHGVDVYAYFNNDWETFAPRNAETLIGLTSPGRPAPDAPRHRRQADPQTL